MTSSSQPNTQYSITPVERVANQEFVAFLKEKFSPLLEQTNPLKVLEVGCGSGALAAILQSEYKDKVFYKPIDPSEPVIEKAKARGVQNAEAVSFEKFNSSDLFDVILFTKSFHHLPSIREGIEKSYTLLKPGGLWIADEFAREAIDEASAKFVFTKVDELDDAGIFPSPPKHTVAEDKKHDYLYRWNSRFMPNAVKKDESGKHDHDHHQHQHHEHQHHEHHHHHENKEKKEENNGANQPHSHHHHHSHSHHHENHQHLHDFPSSVEMLETVRSKFPDVEVTHTPWLFLFIAQRFDDSQLGEKIVREFMEEETRQVQERKVRTMGIRFCAKKSLS